MEITLTKAEQRIVIYIGKCRNKSNWDTGVIDKRVDSTRTSEEINIDGFGAEMAFAKMFNLYPDFTIEPRKGSYDFIRDKKKIDIKSSIYTPTWLTTKRNKSIDEVDYYVMLTGKFPTYSFAGWNYSKILIDDKNLKDWGHGEGKEMYSIPPEELLTFEQLASILTP